MDIYQSLFDRLPFITDTASNRALILRKFVEISNTYNQYLCKSDTDVGDPDKYTVQEKCLLVDLIAHKLIAQNAVVNTTGSNLPAGQSVGTFLSEAKAGPVDVSFLPYDINKAGINYLSGSKLLDYFWRSAFNKAMHLGFYLDECDPCAIEHSQRDCGFVGLISGCNRVRVTPPQGCPKEPEKPVDPVDPVDPDPPDPPVNTDPDYYYGYVDADTDVDTVDVADLVEIERTRMGTLSTPVDGMYLVIAKVSAGDITSFVLGGFEQFTTFRKSDSNPNFGSAYVTINSVLPALGGGMFTIL